MLFLLMSPPSGKLIKEPSQGSGGFLVGKPGHVQSSELFTTSYGMFAWPLLWLVDKNHNSEGDFLQNSNPLYLRSFISVGRKTAS